MIVPLTSFSGPVRVRSRPRLTRTTRESAQISRDSALRSPHALRGDPSRLWSAPAAWGPLDHGSSLEAAEKFTDGSLDIFFVQLRATHVFEAPQADFSPNMFLVFSISSMCTRGERERSSARCILFERREANENVLKADQ